jgi:hypothetical protein
MALQPVNDIWTRGTFIVFRNLGNHFNGTKHKTNLYDVLTQENFLLGRIRWHAPWRKYVFNSSFDTNIYEETCLREIGEFLEQETSRRKQAAKESAKSTS